MAVSRSWRGDASDGTGDADGPVRPRLDDIAELNDVFSDAFTDRYRRDGMTGVRVPFLNPRIWRYAIEDAADGAMIWRDPNGRIVAFNMIHRSGSEGWMGPLAVRSDAQARGRGKAIVMHGMEWLRHRGAAVIGLETMPRTMDNIGFYSRLGFLPGHLTLTISVNAVRGAEQVLARSRLPARDADDMTARARLLLDRLAPGYDYTREIQLTAELGLGDTLLLLDGDDLVGYALAHSVPLVEGRANEELRVLKLVLADERSFDRLVRALLDHAARAGVRRVSFRMQGEYTQAYRQIIALGGHVRWTDLRMAMSGTTGEDPVSRPGEVGGLVLSNWEI